MKWPPNAHKLPFLNKSLRARFKKAPDGTATKSLSKDIEKDRNPLTKALKKDRNTLKKALTKG